MSAHRGKNKIAAAREARGWNQSELARRLKITPQTVQLWERPGGTAPKRVRARQVAELLGLAVEDVMDAWGVPEPVRVDERYELSPEAIEIAKAWQAKTPEVREFVANALQVSFLKQAPSTLRESRVGKQLTAEEKAQLKVATKKRRSTDG